MSIPVQCFCFDLFWILLLPSHCFFYLFPVIIWCQLGKSGTGI